MFEWPYVPGFVSGSLLLTAAYLALQCHRALSQDHKARFWGIAAVGLAYLALDEWFAIHEWVALQLFPDLGVTNHPDDVIILGYAISAMLIGGACWREITEDTTSFRWLCGAALATALAGSLDGFGIPYAWPSAVAEEASEFAAGAMAIKATVTRLATSRPEAQPVPIASWLKRIPLYGSLLK